MKALNSYELDLLMREHYPQFKTRQDFVQWLRSQNWVTVTNKGHKRKRYQVCISALKNK